LSEGGGAAARPAAEGPPVLLIGGLALATAAAWLLMLRALPHMVMPGRASSSEAATFTAQWGLMMAAMMLPSAAPMILLYRTVSRRLGTAGDRVVPASAFAAVYLVVWCLSGVPVYGAYLAVSRLMDAWPGFAAAVPWAVAAVLVTAGLYQMSAAKRVCLRHCEAPLGFLMRRWRSGYAATLELALRHAVYCVGCCWALMTILVAAGAMSMAWVVVITLVVFAEKVLPDGWRTARIVGIALIALGIAIALRPELAERVRGRGAMDMSAHSI
jgi:predicted metal-binding membrane protein